MVAPAPEHARLVKPAIAAGKDVYCEWPLTTRTADSDELLSLAEAKRVRHIVGLQRRMGPSARYTRDLMKQGYVGKIRGVHMTVSADAFVPEMSTRHRWAFDAANFSNVLSIYAAHFGDMLFRSVGFPKKLTAVIETQFPFFTVVETGEQVPNTNPNEVMVIGTLEGGGLFSMQVEGGQKHRTGLQIDISGTEGVLRITNPLAFQNKNDNAIEGMNGDAQTFSPLRIPDKYEPLANSGLDVSVQDLAYLYAAYASDKVNGTSEATNFRDAVRQHHLIDQIYKTSARILRIMPIMFAPLNGVYVMKITDGEAEGFSNTSAPRALCANSRSSARTNIKCFDCQRREEYRATRSSSSMRPARMAGATRTRGLLRDMQAF